MAKTTYLFDTKKVKNEDENNSDDNDNKLDDFVSLNKAKSTGIKRSKEVKES